MADVPASTGRGSSGAFTVCLLKSLAHAKSVSITGGALAEAACEIEIDVLKEPVGKQDQYVQPAVAYAPTCSIVTARSQSNLSSWTLRKPQAGFGTRYCCSSRARPDPLGRTRRSEFEVEAQRHADPQNLHRTKAMEYESRDLLVKGDLESYAALMHEHWLNNRRQSAGIAGERVDRLYDAARSAGALVGKLVGAGGGGFLLLYSSAPEGARAIMGDEASVELPFKFEFAGAMANEFL